MASRNQVAQVGCFELLDKDSDTWQAIVTLVVQQ